MQLHGRVWKFGDCVHTHHFLSGKYDNLVRAGKYAELVPHLLEDSLPSFAAAVRPGDIVVAGRAFGSGKHVRGLIGAFKILQISAILARSFAAEWERACINAGMPALVYDSVHAHVESGDELLLDTSASEARNCSRDQRFAVKPTADELIAILAAGGLEPYMQIRLGLAR